MSRDPKDGIPTAWGTNTFEQKPTPELLRKIQADNASRNAAVIAPREGVSVVDAAKSIKPEDFLKISQYPCHRQGYLSGIGGGAAVGMLRYVLGANIPKATNWAVGVGIAASLISYEVCKSFRHAEKTKMRRIVEVHESKQAEIRQQEFDRARLKREEAEEAATRLAAEKKWYKFW